MLREVLLAELKQSGFHLVEPEQADFTLVYWIDEAWKPGTRVVSSRAGTWPDPSLESGHALMPMSLPYFAPAGFAVYDQPGGIQRVVDAPIATKGIRLKVFPQDSMHSGRLVTAWDGYIEMGSQIHEDREPVLLRTLLNYFGIEFTGRAQLIE